MTIENNTAHPVITWELNEIIGNFETMMSLHSLESTSENDAAAVAEMTAIYGNVLIKDFNDVSEKIKVLEDFYNDNYKVSLRNRNIDKTKLLEMFKDGIKACDIAENLNVGRSTVYKIIGEEAANTR